MGRGGKGAFVKGKDNTRMIKTEENAKVVASAWGAESIHFYGRASYLAPGRFEE